MPRSSFEEHPDNAYDIKISTRYKIPRLQRQVQGVLPCSYRFFIDFIDGNRLISPHKVYNTMRKRLKIKDFYISSFLLLYLLIKLLCKTGRHFSTTNILKMPFNWVTFQRKVLAFRLSFPFRSFAKSSVASIEKGGPSQ